ncbi:gamma-tubulin complex component 3 [Babesia caballi]|uniref:Gamma-tubulin complex component 3 n=1 Tax=Babesia caballi TaxID=5871 RepID=A0AAV4M1L6_BABCB|nr:gamma-tubulin complex component 3 [Babesia caballi]
MPSDWRRRSEPEPGHGGAVLASEVLRLAHCLSQISKDDILLYNLDRLHLSPGFPPARGEGEGGAGSARSTGNIVRLHSQLQRHLEETTMRLLSECADLEVLEIDTNRIARELEHFCVDNVSVSLRRLKAMVYAGMQCFQRLPACLQLLLLLRDGGGPPRVRQSLLDWSHGSNDSLPAAPLSPAHRDSRIARNLSPPLFKRPLYSPPGDSPYQSPRESPYDSPYHSPESDPDSEPDSSPAASLSSRVVTDRFEFPEIAEADLVSDVLFVLQGVEGRFIKRGVHGRFTLAGGLKVSRAVRQLTERTCALGDLYNAIVDARPPEGLISQALYQGVMDEIYQYNHLVNMLVSSRANDPLSLRRLYVWVQQPYTRMRLLRLALDAAPRFSIDGVFDLYCGRGDAMGRELYNELLRKCMVPYLEMLLQWVFFGEIDDGHGLFFVRRVQDHYRFTPSKVPKFMPAALAELCFEVGRCGMYYSQMKGGAHLKSDVDIPGLLRQLCPESPLWSVFVTVQRLAALVRSVDTSTRLVRELAGEHDLGGYLRRVGDHLAMTHLAADPASSAFDDFECNADYGFDIYVPKFSFPLALILEDEKLARDAYITSFRLEFLLQRSLKVLSICWSEYSWHSRCSHGALELSRRVGWINMRRHEMSHFANMLQSARSVQYLLGSFVARVSARDYPPADATLSQLRSEFSHVLSCLRPGNFLELMEILEAVVDFGKFVPRLFHRGTMQQLRSLVREGASPPSLADFIHRNIATDEAMRVLSRHARRFRESVMLLLHRLAGQDAERRRFGAIVDYNGFYHMLSVIDCVRAPSVPQPVGLLPDVDERGHAVQRPHRRDRHLLVVQVLPRHPLDLLGVDLLEPQEELGHGHAPAVDDQLARDLLRHGRGGVVHGEELHHELALGALDLLVRDAVGERGDAEHELAHAVVHRDLVALRVEAEEPRVLVARVEGAEGLRAADRHAVRDGVHRLVARDLARHDPLLALLVAPDDALHEHEAYRVGVRVRPHVVVPVEELRADKLRLLQLPHAGSDRPPGTPASCSGCSQRGPAPLFPPALVTHQYREAQWTAAERRHVQPVEYHLLRRLLDLLHLSEDHVLLRLNLRGLDEAVLEYVAQQLRAPGHVLVEAPRVVPAPHCAPAEPRTYPVCSLAVYALRWAPFCSISSSSCSRDLLDVP